LTSRCALTLNAVNTTFASVTVDDSLARADVTLDAAAETATFTFAQPLAAGAHRLRIEFTARINKFDRGFFFVDYPTDSGVKRLLTSKLEPADARRMFPCWDEPAFKASFALTANDCNALRFGERCLARAFRIAMTDKLSDAGHLSDHG
jgi:aminopeptidase N